MARALILAVVLLAVSACGPSGDKAPFAESRTPPGLAARFLAPDGWSWGFVQVGEAPAQRYGVASPPVAPRAQALILTGYGESAEAWFETVRDLNARGVTVWVLERAGQGGSGRFALPRDLGHAPSLDPDVAAVRALRDVVIRPRPDAPFVVLAHDDAAIVALLAAERGMAADGLILSAPRWPPPDEAPARLSSLADALGLGARRPPGWRAWRRDGEDAGSAGLTHDPVRGRVQHAWQTSNPDLRMGGASAGWRAALAEGRRAAGEALSRVAPPVLVVSPGAHGQAASDLCTALPRCTLRSVPEAGPALHLERDAVRDRWLEDVGGFIAARDEAADPP